MKTRGLRGTVHLLAAAALSADQRRALDEQVDRVAHVLEGTPSLTIGTVTVGPHA